MDRRDAIKLVSKYLGGAISAPVATALLSGCTAIQATGTTGTLSPDRLQLAGLLAERIIPTTDTPGALAAGVDRYIGMAVSQFFGDSEKSVYLNGLDEVDRRAQSLFGSSFANCTLEQQNQIVGELDGLAYGRTAQPDNNLGRFFRFQKELTVTGYYTSEIGQTEELHIAPFGIYDADVPLSEIGRTWA